MVVAAPDLGGDQGARAPHQLGLSHHVHVYWHMYNMCVLLSNNFY